MASSENLKAVFEMQAEIEHHENRIESIIYFQDTFLGGPRTDREGEYLVSYEGSHYIALYEDARFCGLYDLESPEGIEDLTSKGRVITPDK